MRPNGRRNPGRKFYRSLTAKTQPLDIARCSQQELLAVLFSPQVAQNLILAAEGDIRNLAGRDIRDLVGIAGMNEAYAARLAALFALFNQLVTTRPNRAG